MSLSKNPGCLASLFGIFTRPKAVHETAQEEPQVDSFPYRLRDDFLSPAEQSFYLVLKGMMGEHFTICPKVSLADIFFVARPHENRSAYNRINRKHVDFLVCDPKTMVPKFAIELDDSSHERPDREERDAFVDGVFEAADLPLLHIPVRASYSTAELGVLFKGVLQKGSGQPVPVRSPDPSEVVRSTQSQPPLCPKCDVPMVLRTARSGDQAGRSFYGCPNYPRCRVILPAQSR